MKQIDKPRHGAPCNGCGHCCMSSPCPLASATFGDKWSAPCPALERSAGKHACGMILHPERYVPALVRNFGAPVVQRSAAVLLGVGTGCDAFDPDIPGDEEVPEATVRSMLYAFGFAIEIAAARGVWGI